MNKIITLMIFSASIIFAAGNFAGSKNSQNAENELYEFTYTLDFAQKLGFKKIVNLMEEEKYKKALTDLETKTFSNFEWNFSSTNGYQAGFFAEALKGICLEKIGEVVKAYRAYQNARYYCDEDEILQNPGPKLEVWTGIGRICCMLLRFSDAINYLDAARMEAAEYETIVVAADTALIGYYGMVGDNKAACEMFDDIGTRIKLSRDQYISYTRLLFERGLDRAAFAQLLHGIAKYGFDEDLGIKDPMLNLFLNALPRANDQEIKNYYDLNGYWLEEARAEKKDEKYIMMLLKTRLLFSKVFSFLSAEDDLNKLKQRVQYLKTNMIYNVAARYQKTKYDHQYHLIPQTRLKNSTVSTNDLTSLSREAELEDLLNKGFLCLGGFGDRCKEAYKHYSRFAELCTNDTLKAVAYDDTNFEAFYDFIPCITSVYGLAFYPDLTRIVEITDNLSTANCGFSKNLSFIKLTLLGMLSMHPATESKFEDLREELDNIPIMFKEMYLTQEILKNLQNKDFETALEIANYTFKDSDYIQSPDLYYNAVLLNIATGNTEKAFRIALNGMLYFDTFVISANNYSKNNFWYREFCRNISAYASEADLIKFNRVQLISEIKSFLLYYSAKDSGQKLKAAIDFQNNIFPNELALRECWQSQDYQGAINIMNDQLKNNRQPAHALKLAQYYRQIGKLEAAYDSIVEAYELKKDLSSSSLNTDLYYPTVEDKYIEKMKIEDNQELLKKHFDWLQKRAERLKSQKRVESANAIRKKLDSYPLNQPKQ